MARRFIVKVNCDLCDREMDEKEATLVDFTWMGKPYTLDVGPEELDSLTMNTVGGLIEVAAEGPAPTGVEDESPAPPARPRLVASAGESSSSAAATAGGPAGGRGKIVPGAGKRRYKFEDYYALWGVQVGSAQQLKCPIAGCRASYVTEVIGESREDNYRRLSRLRSHMDIFHHGEIMWMHAAIQRGDPYDPDAEDKRTVG